MKIGPWEDYLEPGKKKFYKCEECQTHSAIMKRRIVEDSDGKAQEFKVTCMTCGKSGSVHRSKTLAEKTWEALGDSFYIDMTLKRRNTYSAYKGGRNG